MVGRLPIELLLELLLLLKLLLLVGLVTRTTTSLSGLRLLPESMSHL
ncbi:MAG: hypothetical protein PHG85_01125 [Candidatus Altiarchaeota archaeon]|nr:hypothetical protein [Candidatus Altiarchaeota archaeon]